VVVVAATIKPHVPAYIRTAETDPRVGQRVLGGFERFQQCQLLLHLLSVDVLIRSLPDHLLQTLPRGLLLVLMNKNFALPNAASPARWLGRKLVRKNLIDLLRPQPVRSFSRAAKAAGGKPGSMRIVRLPLRISDVVACACEEPAFHSKADSG